MIDQISFSHSDSMTNMGSIVPLIENSQMTTKSIGVGMYPSLMGNFNFSTPISYINVVLVFYQQSSSSIPMTQVSSFQMTYFKDP
jgi:hypothetical protein